MHLIDDLIAQIKATDTVLDGAATYIAGVPGLVKEAIDKALAGADVPALLAEMKGKGDLVLKAIADNTPSPPPTPVLLAKAKGK